MASDGSRRVHLHQCLSPAGDAEAAFGEIAAGLEGARRGGAAMAVFPELMLPGYNAGTIPAQAQPLAGPWVARLTGMARAAGCGVTAGLAERDGATVHNSAVCVGADGALLGAYRKIQLYGPREKRLFSPGDRYAVFDWAGLKTALLICYDIEFAGHVRALAEQGVELILCPTANMEPFSHVCRMTVASQAINHAVAIVYANYCGAEGDLTYCGRSVAVAADGAVLAQAGIAPAGLTADLSYGPDAALLSTQLADYRPVRGPFR